MTAILTLSSLHAVDAIPLHINQVCYQGRTYRVETQIRSPGLWWRIQQFAAALFLSLATLGVGLAFSSVRTALKIRWEQALTGKLISRHLIEPPPSQPIESPDSGSALNESVQAELTQLKESYDQIYESTLQPQIHYGLELLKIDIEDDASVYSTITSDRNLGNLPLLLEEGSTAFFIPNAYFIEVYRGYNANPNTEEGFNAFKKYLAAAFASGKEFVIARFANDIHVVVGAFRSDGKFKIIDSLLDQTIDLTRLTDALNQAQIKDASGNPLTFRGKYINTHLQKGGHECMRFATLYGYQMAKRQGFKGYKEVNGALAEGRLRRFEDISRIDEAPLLKDAATVPSQNYKSFMHSWAYRTYGIKKESWQELTLAELKNNRDDNTRYILRLTSSGFVSTYPVSLGDSLTLEDGSPPPSMPLSENWEQISLGSLVPEGANRVAIVIDPNKDPLVFRLSADQKMPRIGII